MEAYAFTDGEGSVNYIRNQSGFSEHNFCLSTSAERESNEHKHSGKY
jgi:hypothetical protein